MAEELSATVGPALVDALRDVRPTKSVGVGFFFWQKRVELNCKRTDFSDPICSICTLHWWKLDGLSGSVSTALEETKRSMRRKKSVFVKVFLAKEG